MARNEVVVLSGNRDRDPGVPNTAVEAWATGEPVQPAAVYSFTTVPAAALPLTFGLLLFAGEDGFVAVIFGVGGGIGVDGERPGDRGAHVARGVDRPDVEDVGALGEGANGVNGDEHAANGRASKWHWKVEPIWFEANLKVGVASLMRPPLGGPEVMSALGGIASAEKLLNAFIAGFAVWSKRSSPALPQKLHIARERRGSRQWYQNTCSMFHAVRWLRISLKAPFSKVA